MLNVDTIIFISLVLIGASTWMYSIGYKDGKREGHLLASKYRKQVR